MKYMEMECSEKDAEIILVGIPYDGTTSYKPGARFAPNEIRSNALIGYETYSPKLHKDLTNIKLCDIGDMDIFYTEPEIMMNEIYNKVIKYIERKKKIVSIGGDHSITFGIIKALREKNENLKVIQFDAHTDLRESFLGSKYSHACVMKRVVEEIGDKNLYQFGIRSGLKEEFNYAKNKTNLFQDNFEKLHEIVSKLEDEPVYITIDLDVLDPAFFPGTGTPEPNGVTSKELFDAIYKLKELKNIVGFDIVELSPKIDNSEISTATAIKVLREMLLII